MERMAVRLREVGGVFIQMEDEIASISAVIGASWAGAKAMTATAGPGFSLMQEAIGYAAFTETPCVVIDVQRAGPCTGQATGWEAVMSCRPNGVPTGITKSSPSHPGRCRRCTS